MSRQLRLEHSGAIWHVTSRGNERRDIYRDDHDRRFFLSLLARVVRERRWRLHAWVLMSNHYHLLLETPEIGLSRGMQWLNKQYAERFNRRYERAGHLFQGRFKGILVEREAHLLELIRYIVLNPVRAGVAALAADYDWSSYRATAGLQRTPLWLDVSWTLDQFDPNHVVAREAYRQFVAAAGGAPQNPWEALHGQIYLGGEEFCDRVQTLVDAKPRSIEHPDPQRHCVRASADAIVREVCDEYAISCHDLQRRIRGEARKALCLLLVDDAGMTVTAVAQWLRITAGAASKLRAAGRANYAADTEFRGTIERIRAKLK